ncbi:cytochrome b [Pleionea sp. CnH1-48]|uniref:cytochrome b n=1 Tax=Pleionea sp. CnH1-48 TaxID=2954494 RepID=UPI002097CA12|nr:cytochrome b [Pleionea sp. CnH1-48]MCO7225825.1 cytochrome b [Pleionea sp. CnH1-48]
MWKDNNSSYGWTSILFHWLSALAVIFLFGLGFWMVELDYYHTWYNRSQWLHEGMGLLVLFFTLLRLIWRSAQPKISPVETGITALLAQWTHRLLYLLLLAALITGFIIASEDKEFIVVLDWFNVPALNGVIENQADTLGIWHKYLTYSLIGLALIHAVAALYHHFVHKNEVLKRMLKPFKK